MFLLMWFAMMVAMMLPSAMPMLINYRRCLPVESAGGVGASTLIVACSYFVVWMGIGIAVYVIGVLWAYATMKWSGLSRLVPVLIGATLIFLGVIQFSRWKLAWLMRCRDPLACAASQTGGGWRNPMRHGLQQGVSCAICCSAPMSALLVLGAMDLTVMVFVAVVIAMEKLVPKPEPVVRLFGVVAIVTGIVLVLRSTAF
jgi:predicted metal-binding membrane protein